MEKSAIDNLKKRFGGADESIVNEQVKEKRVVDEEKRKARNEEKGNDREVFKGQFVALIYCHVDSSGSTLQLLPLH